MAKKTVIQTTFEPEDGEQVKSAAKQEGLNTSEYTRRLITKGMADETTPEGALLKAGLAKDLRQASRFVNLLYELKKVASDL